VTVFWNPTRLVFLRPILTEVHKYQRHVHVDVVMVTNAAPALERVLRSWGHKEVAVVPFHRPNKPNTSLLYGYRGVMEKRFNNPGYTTYITIEDDTFVPWSALLSWALDTAILEPLGFTRGIYRTEVALDGTVVLVDALSPLNLTIHPRKLNVSDARPPEALGRNATDTSDPTDDENRFKTIHPHLFYVQLDNFYQGMSLITRSQLEIYMNNSLWRQDGCRFWGYPECSHSNVFVDPPLGYQGNVVVPYVITDRGPVLSLLARVEHMRNGYAVLPNNQFGRVRLQAALYN